MIYVRLDEKEDAMGPKTFDRETRWIRRERQFLLTRDSSRSGSDALERPAPARLHVSYAFLR